MINHAIELVLSASQMSHDPNFPYNQQQWQVGYQQQMVNSMIQYSNSSLAQQHYGMHTPSVHSGASAYSVPNSTVGPIAQKISPAQHQHHIPQQHQSTVPAPNPPPNRAEQISSEEKKLREAARLDLVTSNRHATGAQTLLHILPAALADELQTVHQKLQKVLSHGTSAPPVDESKALKAQTTDILQRVASHIACTPIGLAQMTPKTAFNSLIPSEGTFSVQCVTELFSYLPGTRQSLHQIATRPQQNATGANKASESAAASSLWQLQLMLEPDLWGANL